METSYVWPLENEAVSKFVAASAIVPFATTSSRSVPVPGSPVLTVTVYDEPLPVTFVTDALVMPLVVKVKSALSTPVTLSLNVTV